MLVMLKILSTLLDGKKIKSVKRSKNFFSTVKIFESPNIVEIKSAIIEHLKSCHKSSKTIRQTKEISQVSGPGRNSSSPMYSKTKK